MVKDRAQPPPPSLLTPLQPGLIIGGNNNCTWLGAENAPSKVYSWLRLKPAKWTMETWGKSFKEGEKNNPASSPCC